ncbi:MAG: glycoside hydrolase family 172 protein [Chloroflexota bacterium]|nr:glycoside hydrolase family 172 protein [Chloroflexota bacterium]
MNIDLNNIFEKRDAESRSLSAENFRAEKGQGGMATAENTLHPGSAEAASELGQGWKVSPCLSIPAGQTVEIMDNDGPGVIRHMWMTLDDKLFRDIILRIFWDDEATPSVECPIGDFFCCSWNASQRILAQPINVNSVRGLNCFFPMPYRKHARITLHNDSPHDLAQLYYTINYTLEPVPEESLYFHAQWRRTNPLPYMTDYTLVDGISGQGQYVGTFMAWQTNNSGWWGEGEIKMFVDGDDKYPTICGTGTEDYFGGAWCFADGNYSAPYFGYQLVTGEVDRPGARVTLYRFHILDPVFFKRDLRVTIQALGWRSDQRYLPLQDDISSVVYWYQTDPHGPFPELPDRNAREII